MDPRWTSRSADALAFIDGLPSTVRHDLEDRPNRVASSLYGMEGEIPGRPARVLGAGRLRQHLRVLERARGRTRPRRPDHPGQLWRRHRYLLALVRREKGAAPVQHGWPGGDGVRPPGKHRRLPRQRQEAHDQHRRRRRLPAEHPRAGDGCAAGLADQVLRPQQSGLCVDPGDPEQPLPRDISWVPTLRAG